MVEIPDSLAEQAKAHGLAPARYVESLLAEKASTMPPSERGSELGSAGPEKAKTAEEWSREFHAWVDSHDATGPVLSDESISRESIYAERGL